MMMFKGVRNVKVVGHCLLRTVYMSKQVVKECMPSWARITTLYSLMQEADTKTLSNNQPVAQCTGFGDKVVKCPLLAILSTAGVGKRLRGCHSPTCTY